MMRDEGKMIKMKKLRVFIIHHSSLILHLFFLIPGFASAQRVWIIVDSLYQPLPSSFHIYRSDQPLDGKPFIAYYAEASLKDRSLEFVTDTTMGRRLTPSGFYQKNNAPLLVVNGTFFSFETNKNLNLVIRNGKLVGFNNASARPRGKDSLTTFIHSFPSAIGIKNNREADVAWTFTDSTKTRAYVSQIPVKPVKDSNRFIGHSKARKEFSLKKWKMKTAIGGGPVLLQNGKVFISNDDERRFAGKAILDKHPRTLMGYTSDGRLIIMVIQGRMTGIAEGASLEQEAQLMLELGCVEALNLDGGGSSCMLINGKETIKPSDKEGQRPVPGIFMIAFK